VLMLSVELIVGHQSISHLSTVAADIPAISHGMKHFT